MEKQQNRKRIQTNIKILGNFSTSIQTTQQQFNSLININIDVSFKPYHHKFQDNRINPIKIIAQGNTIAFIDDKDCLWLIAETFNRPVNLSSIIHKKVRKFSLNEKQIIASTKKDNILLNWGSKKLFDNADLFQIPISQRSSYNQIFKAYKIDKANIGDDFIFSTMKKCDNSNKMYQIKKQKNLNKTQVIGFPSLQTFSVPFIINGVSIGKYHCLCWDNNGRLYSWGNKTIALGYQNLPLQMQINQPKPVENLKGFITTAFAASNYSLALSTQGIIYQWGIKKDINQFNDKLIFKPSPIKVTKQQQNKSNKNINFVSLKGKKDYFSAISTEGNFYIWGFDCKHIIEKLNLSIFVNDRIYQPTLVQDLSQYKIIDYIMEDRFIAFITTSKNNNFMMTDERVYWDQMLANVQQKWGNRIKRLKTDQNQFQNKSISKESFRNNNRFSESLIKYGITARNPIIQPSNFKHIVKDKNLTERFSSINFSNNGKVSQDKIQTQFKRSKLKQKYLQMAQNQKDFFNYIMQGSCLNKQKALQKQNKTLPKQKVIKKKFFIKSQNKEKNTERSPDHFHFAHTLCTRASENDATEKLSHHIKSSININQIKQFIHQHQKRQIKVHHYQKIKENSPVKLLMKKMVSCKSYKIRLNQVKQKKRNIDYQIFYNTWKKVQENSLQFRQKKHEQNLRKKQYQKQMIYMKKTIQSYLIKNIIIQGLCQPLGQARRLKIDNFGLQLKLQRKQKLIRNLFAKSKAKSSINHLQIQSFSTFMTLCHVFKTYIKRRRKQKYQKMRSFIVQQIFKSIMKEKIRIGMARINLTVKKLQRLHQWLKITKKQRLKCLKVIWKHHLLNFLKYQNEGDNNAYQSLKIQQVTFTTLYQEKVNDNPNLRLINFLNSNAIFRLRFQYFEKITDLFMGKQHQIYKSQRIIKTMNTLNNGSMKKTKIRFIDQDRQKFGNLGIQNTQIFPYSLHANIFVKPPAYEINMPQPLKNNDKWVKQQKQILEKCLLTVIKQHDINYQKERRKYDYELALFIKTRYEKLSEKRWKSIIEYNKIVKTFGKKRKQKQLKRLLNLVGASYLFEQDVLPQKYLVLQQALKRSDAPKQPNSSITFGNNQFKKNFKHYFQLVHSRMRHLRKSF